MMQRKPRSIGLGIALALWLGALASAACAPGDRGASDGPGTSTLERLTGEVERGVVAVMPFNVSGAESDLGYLETALPDLLSRKLNYRDPPGRVFDATDLPSARRQALDAGAMDVVMGAVVGGADRLTIRATLRRTRAGRVLAEESVTGGLDSLDALTSRLALQLTLWDLDPAGRAIIGSTSIPVIDATLGGFVALRKEDWVGAADAFQAALALDSTFGIAAEGLFFITSNPRSTATLDRAEVNRLVQSLRDRMTAGTRTWMEAGRRPDTARVWTVLRRLRAWETAVEAYPNHPMMWGRLAYFYYWQGAYVGVEDWYRRALHAFQQVNEFLDFDVPCEAYNHLLLRWEAERDQAVLSEYARACRPTPEQWPNPRERVFQRLLTAGILRDTAELRRIRNSRALDSIPARQGGWFSFYFVQPGYGLKEWRAAIAAFERNATTETERLDVKRNQLLVARVAGQPAQATALLRERLASGLLTDPWLDLSLPIMSALLEPGWEEIGAEAGYRNQNPDPSWPDTTQGRIGLEQHI